MNRVEMIDWLVRNDMDYINETSGGGLEWLEHILRDGFDGYSNQPDAALKTEILERDPEAFKEKQYA